MTTSIPTGTEAADVPVEVADLVGPSMPLRIGIIVPHDMALDGEMWRWTPKGVTLHFTREAFVPLPVTVEMAMLIGDPTAIAQCVADISTIELSVVAYGCTSGSFANGILGENSLVSSMEAAGAQRALTTSGAVLNAIEHLGAKRVSIATPYDEPMTALLDEYLEEAGAEVVGKACLGLHEKIWEVGYARTTRLIRQADRPDADAIVVSCTNLPTYDVIAPLERELGKPIVTANQATMWAALRAINKHAIGQGQALLDG
ncbi:aspartate/glutamate racemase family protein [Nocardioidaceae bacterium SCSIO 66511]|nr:aspartate/glutamate racemase family protein [Nocardioidaceae bacterium SCSIO 66511]